MPRSELGWVGSNCFSVPALRGVWWPRSQMSPHAGAVLLEKAAALRETTAGCGPD